MAFLDQINVNVGTEANPSFVLHDIHDVRFSSTAVTTASHLLATDASLSYQPHYSSQPCISSGYGVGFEIKITNSSVSLYMDIQHMKMYIVSVDSTFATRHWSISDN